MRIRSHQMCSHKVKLEKDFFISKYSSRLKGKKDQNILCPTVAEE